MTNLYFTKPLAEAIAFDFQYLVGSETIPTRIGELQIDSVKVVEINSDEFDIVVTSNAENILYREIYQALNYTSIRLMRYIELKKMKFYPNHYGIGYAKITFETDTNGIDLYL